MSYTESMWNQYRDKVVELYSKGYTVWEIAKVLESSEELVARVIETQEV